MPQLEASDSQFPNWLESSRPSDDDVEIVRLSAARARAMDEAGAEIARQLTGPMTALLLYMGELKQHSHQFSQGAGNRTYLQQVVENALQQTEHVCAIVKQLGDGVSADSAAGNAGSEKRPGRDRARTPGVIFSSSPG